MRAARGGDVSREVDWWKCALSKGRWCRGAGELCLHAKRTPPLPSPPRAPLPRKRCPPFASAAAAGAATRPPTRSPPSPPANVSAAQAARAEKKSRKRNLTLLSFGEDAELEEAQLKDIGRK
jgi:hypothetical protein